MSELLAQAQAMQSQLMEAQANLENQEVEGTAGGGLVTAMVSGTGELLSLTINPQAVDPDDTETLADLIVAAVRDASENAKEVAARAMGPLAGGLGGGLPGFGGGAPETVPGDDQLPGDQVPGDQRPGDQRAGNELPGSERGNQLPGNGQGPNFGFTRPGSEPGQNPG
ncbi:YbaB/EbfC family nucleoid-associated protein [Kribbella italica]|uniref:Nucleoid-associated protein HDA39_006461 n=1 Tax=Kribbella italica TaxID=1540520 RepID=A0A7W9JDE6_9ACTN|nr:DNA-binding YbaB/EbfC family protein [Kribbella italica]